MEVQKKTGSHNKIIRSKNSSTDRNFLSVEIGKKDEKPAGARLALGRLFEFVGEKPDHLMQAIVALHLRGDRFAGMKNRSVVSATKRLPDLL